MEQLGFFFDNGRCSGCKTCVIACKDYKHLGPEASYRHVYDYEGGSWRQGAHGAWEQDAFMYHVSVSCNHCARPICTHVCPTGAMHKEANGIVRVNAGVCVGCGYCTLSCPYGAPSVSDVTHVSVKCDGCYDRVIDGRKPICVEACPLRALDFDGVAALRSRHGSGGPIAPMPDASHTLPNIIIKASPAARRPGDRDGFIANPKEL